MRGVIKAILRKRKDEEGKVRGGFGFILDEEHNDRFFHMNELLDTPFEELHEGQQVDFDPVEIPGKGLRAARVRAIR